MKNLVVYYSRSSNTEAVANEISKAVNGGLKKIELTKEPSFGWAAISALFGLKEKINEIDFNISDYDNVFIGTPVWAGKSSTPINTLLNKTDFTGKNVFTFITQADPSTPTKVFNSIEKRIEDKGGKVIDRLFVQTNMKIALKSHQVVEPVNDWINKNKMLL